MTPEEIETIDSWRQEIGGELRLELLVAEDGTKDPDMEAFAEDLNTLVPQVSWKASDEHPLFAPGFRIGENVFFQMVPSQKELSPFLRALVLLDGRPTSLSDAVRDALAENQLPAHIKLYVAPTCPHCPAVVRQMLDIAAESGRISLHVIDGARFPEKAEQDDVQSVPTLVLEDRFRWTGSVSSDELAGIIRQRDPSMLGISSLRGLIENGDAQSVAEMMLASVRCPTPIATAMTIITV
jgi:alkyl hydroperoxide reductase subunit AhpF